MTKAKSSPGLSHLEKRAEVAKAVKIRGSTLTRVLKEEIGISHSHFLYLMEGVRNPSPRVAEGIAKLCNMSPLEFWGRTKFNPVFSGGSQRTENPIQHARIAIV